MTPGPSNYPPGVSGNEPQITGDYEMSLAAQQVLRECESECWMNADASDVHTASDIASDVVARLIRTYELDPENFRETFEDLKLDGALANVSLPEDRGVSWGELAELQSYGREWLEQNPDADQDDVTEELQLFIDRDPRE